MGLEQVCHACCGCLIRASYRPTDSDKERNLKGIVMPSALFAVVAMTVILLIEWSAQGVGVKDFYQLGMVLVVPVSAAVPASLLLGNPNVVRLTEYMILALVWVVVLIDWRNSAMLGGRVWSMAVVIADLGFVVEARPWVTNYIIIIMAVWIMIEGIESSLHFGLYDLAFFSDRETPALCDCPSPPCKRGAAGAVSFAFNTVFIFFIDFFVTRGFASQMHQQLRMVESSVQVAEGITAHLSSYETGRAREVVEGEEGAGLPEALRCSLQQLVANLESYRPFLPQSCLPQEGAEGSSESELADADQTSGSEAASVAKTPTEGCAITPLTGTLQGEAFNVPRSNSAATAESLAKTASEASRMTPMSPTASRRKSELHRMGKFQPAAGAISSAPRVAAVTVACANRRGFLEEITRHAAGAELVRELSDWLAAGVHGFLQVVAKNKGVVDNVSSDHFFASFAAARPCVSHRTAAVRSMFSLRASWGGVEAPQGSSDSLLWSLPTSIAACSSRSVVGDFGNDQMKKFMVVGTLAWRLLATERLAAATGAGLLCDAMVADDASSSYELRQRRPVIFRKLGAGKPHCLYEVTHIVETSASGPAEWMYELQHQRNRWDPLNSVIREWERSPQEAAALASTNAQHCEGDVLDALSAVQRLISEGEQAALEIGELYADSSGGAGPRVCTEASRAAPAALVDAGHVEDYDAERHTR
eukprot:TRINITY_DN14363_c0_g3_i2.p1 TRINITY_DN14363_c0_g3~~TRINITY_DN14363_c0_g3_i2.p1  ORF type:complete len:739 (+),score=165.42 TRINITY_DN14363_c0_g3_i2:103-2217(+)